MKPHLNIEQQVGNLSNMGLTIVDKAAASNFLTRINYFHLRSYCDDLIGIAGNFLPGVTFERVTLRFETDWHLRNIVFALAEFLPIEERNALTAGIVAAAKRDPSHLEGLGFPGWWQEAFSSLC